MIHVPLLQGGEESDDTSKTNSEESAAERVSALVCAHAHKGGGLKMDAF